MLGGIERKEMQRTDPFADQSITERRGVREAIECRVPITMGRFKSAIQRERDGDRACFGK